MHYTLKITRGSGASFVPAVIADSPRSALARAAAQYNAPAPEDADKFRPPYTPKIDANLKPATLAWVAVQHFQAALDQLEQGPERYRVNRVALIDVVNWATGKTVEALQALALAYQGGIVPIDQPNLLKLLAAIMLHINQWAVDAVEDAYSRGKADAFKQFNERRTAVEKALDLAQQGLEAFKKFTEQTGIGAGVVLAGAAVVILALWAFSRR